MTISEEVYGSLIGGSPVAKVVLSRKVLLETERFMTNWLAKENKINFASVPFTSYRFEGRDVAVLRRGKKNYRCVIYDPVEETRKEKLIEWGRIMPVHGELKIMDVVRVLAPVAEWDTDIAVVIGLIPAAYEGYHQAVLMSQFATKASFNVKPLSVVVKLDNYELSVE